MGLVHIMIPRKWCIYCEQEMPFSGGLRYCDRCHELVYYSKQDRDSQIRPNYKGSLDYAGWTHIHISWPSMRSGGC